MKDFIFVNLLDVREDKYNLIEDFPNFNPLEFEGVKREAGLNAFTMSPSKWIDLTNAVGIITQASRYGGTYACSDIAFIQKL